MKYGPLYGVPLIDSLPLGTGGMRQSMPTREDLEQVREVNERVVAGYEVLLGHFLKLKEDGQTHDSGGESQGGGTDGR